MRFKLALDAGDAAAAAREVGRLAGCDGFEPAALRVACQEAIGAGCAPVARAALLQLHALLAARADAARAAAAADGAVDGAEPADAPAGGVDAGLGGALSEATVLRCLVRLGLDEVAAAAAEAPPPAAATAAAPAAGDTTAAPAPAAEPMATDDGPGAAADAPAAAAGAQAGGVEGGIPGALGRLGQWLHLAAARVAALGLPAFAGGLSAPHAAEQLEWLAGAGWNAALDAAAAREFEAAAVLAHACAQLLGALPESEASARALRQRRMAYLVAGSAALEVCKGAGGTGGGQRRSSLALASRMVAASREAAARLAEVEGAGAEGAVDGAAAKAAGGPGAGAGAGGGSAGGNGGGLADVFALLQEFGIAARRGDGPAMAAALAAAEAHASVTADHLLRMAAVAEDPEFGCAFCALLLDFWGVGG